MATTSSPKPGSPTPSRPPADAPEVVQRVHEGLSLVDIIASQLRRELGGRVNIDDLASFGREGLLSAARSFDPTLGVPFRRWASYRVRGSMLDGARSASLLPRSVYERIRAVEAANHSSEAAAQEASAAPPQSAQDADARLGTYLAGIATAVALGLLAAPTEDGTGDSVDPAPSADEVLGRSETLDAVRQAMQTLPEQERHLVQRHYFDDVRLDEAAGELGLSKSWGSRLHARAIESLTREMKRTKTTR